MLPKCCRCHTSRRFHGSESERSCILSLESERKHNIPGAPLHRTRVVVEEEEGGENHREEGRLFPHFLFVAMTSRLRRGAVPVVERRRITSTCSSSALFLVTYALLAPSVAPAGAPVGAFAPDLVY